MLNGIDTITQSQYYRSEKCRDAISALEKKYSYIDERNDFASLVNFSNAKNEPYQRWVRYREGYSTLLVDELLDRANLDERKYCIADPMVGSGSTMIAAARRGFSSFGLDVNPYCKLICETKLLQPTTADIEGARFFAESIKPSDEMISSDALLQDYFPNKNRSALYDIRRQISVVEIPIAKKILEAAWFFILEACSNRKKDGNGLATRPALVNDVFPFFQATVADIVRDFTENPLPNGTLYAVYTDSAKNFAARSGEFEKQSGKKLGAIIFSPPYANAFDYFESYKIELLFGGFYKWDQFKEAKKKLIRNYRISNGKALQCDYPIVESLCAEISEAIPIKEERLGKRDGRTRLMPNMLRGYFQDMGDVLQQLYSSLHTGGHCYIVVDQSAYVGVIVPTDVLLAYIAELKGFSVERISICRRAMTSGQQIAQYPYLSDSLRESIISLTKKH